MVQNRGEKGNTHALIKLENVHLDYIYKKRDFLIEFILFDRVHVLLMIKLMFLSSKRVVFYTLKMIRSLVIIDIIVKPLIPMSLRLLFT